MEGYQTEEQLLVAVRDFWRSNRRFIISLLVISFGVMFGTHKWRDYQIHKSEQASSLYQELLTAVQNVDVTGAKDKGELLLKKYSGTPYAALSAMILAKISIDEEDMPAAIEKFRHVVNNSKKTPLWHIAKIKLARLLYAQGENQQALKELDASQNGYIPLYEELKGDIYVTLNDLDQARAAYKKAMAAANGGVPWVEMKLATINTVEDALKKGVIDGPAVKTNN